MAEINRRSVLIECLAIMREELQICSKNWNGLEPKEGMEEAWQQCRQKIEILKDMIQSLQSEPVRRALAALEEGMTPDAVLTDAEEALAALGELDGRTLREDLVEAIFSRFCVGK